MNREFGPGRPLFPRFDAVDGPLGRSGTASTIETNPFTTNRPELVWVGNQSTFSRGRNSDVGLGSGMAKD